MWVYLPQSLPGGTGEGGHVVGEAQMCVSPADGVVVWWLKESHWISLDAGFHAEGPASIHNMYIINHDCWYFKYSSQSAFCHHLHSSGPYLSSVGFWKIKVLNFDRGTGTQTFYMNERCNAQVMATIDRE